MKMRQTDRRAATHGPCGQLITSAARHDPPLSWRDPSRHSHPSDRVLQESGKPQHSGRKHVTEAELQTRKGSPQAEDT
ncbi:hypothetical protein E2C01_004396 [Portunus trituberculatus]|uniref:Uncharacterized protein n=1 Tax=Portunus trituberculatus TaxID=210409 RepID=A0A5B7CPV5_PORTR|nr:hypothetical protein [Portunus trituberculatus]